MKAIRSGFFIKLVIVFTKKCLLTRQPRNADKTIVSPPPPEYIRKGDTITDIGTDIHHKHMKITNILLRKY